MDSFIQKIKEGLQRPLPGVEAHYKMSHVTRKYYNKAPSDARIACVLALFYPSGSEWQLTYIERDSTNPNDRHSGQISFPGGKYEPEDRTFEQGALRETEEEIGVPQKDIQLLGRLTELYIPVSDFLVYPFVGFLDYEPRFIPQPGEVKSVIHVPFSELLRPEIVQVRDLRISPAISLKKVPYYDLNGKTLWGATAMMTSELTEVYRAVSV
ncbi:MAG: CoA pyrophosphatase [Bacteroidetes bacterium]|nr:MAG: CoA pyrophosphatase [Bacteroidota bacterium]